MTKTKSWTDNIMFDYLDQLLTNAPVWTLGPEDKIIIFSDLHLGNRKMRDDFLPNSGLFMRVLQHYYYPGDYRLILNGDVEELQRVSLDKIKNKWQDFYDLLRLFDRENRLCKIVGNHDEELWLRHSLNPQGAFGGNDVNRRLQQALRLKWHEEYINVLHGHQTSSYRGVYNYLVGFFLRYMAHPLGIKNMKRSYDNPRQLKSEKKIYDYSLSRGTVTLMGHTHRPLFESHSDVDFLKFQIEGLIREYLKTGEEGKARIKKRLSQLVTHLDMLLREESRFGHLGSIYNEMVIPCVFNSGSVLNKNGITGLEISNEEIALVFWSTQKFLEDDILKIEEETEMGGEAFRYVLKKDSLDYIFTRIRLMESCRD